MRLKMNCPNCGAALFANGETEETLSNNTVVICKVFECSSEDCDYWEEGDCIEEEDSSPDKEVELPPEFTQHTGFYLQTGSGHVGHVFGDPNMSEKTKHALMQLIDLAAGAVDRGEIEPDEDNHE